MFITRDWFEVAQAEADNVFGEGAVEMTFSMEDGNAVVECNGHNCGVFEDAENGRVVSFNTRTDVAGRMDWHTFVTDPDHTPDPVSFAVVVRNNTIRMMMEIIARQRINQIFDRMCTVGGIGWNQEE